MNLYPIDVFFTLLITMGPLKVMLVYVHKTRSLDSLLRKRIAIRAVLIATVVALVFIVLGKFLMDLFHFSIAALLVAGGAILFLYGVRMVLAPADDEHQTSEGSSEDQEDADGMGIAVFPLAMPLMATPIGIVALTILSARFGDDTASLLVIAVIVLVVMAINLAVLLAESRYADRINSQAIDVAERVLGILLAALAVQVMFNGLAEAGIITLAAGGKG